MAKAGYDEMSGICEEGQYRGAHQHIFAKSTAWIARLLRHRVQGRSLEGLWTMNRDGHVVRQSWQVLDEQKDLDCAPCCM